MKEKVKEGERQEKGAGRRQRKEREEEHWIKLLWYFGNKEVSLII